jgi:hypothetical protein
MLVIIESPYAGNVEKNTKYAQACMMDSLGRGEFPFASHLLYTQMLDDSIPEQRTIGINAGLAWGQHAGKTVVYTDLGISSGMMCGIKNAFKSGREIEYRKIY